MGMNRLLTVREIAELFQTTRQQVRKMLRNGEIPAVKVGREWRIPQEYLEEFIEENIM